MIDRQVSIPCDTCSYKKNVIGKCGTLLLFKELA